MEFSDNIWITPNTTQYIISTEYSLQNILIIYLKIESKTRTSENRCWSEKLIRIQLKLAMRFFFFARLFHFYQSSCNRISAIRVCKSVRSTQKRTLGQLITMGDCVVISDSNPCTHLYISRSLNDSDLWDGFLVAKCLPMLGHLTWPSLSTIEQNRCGSRRILFLFYHYYLPSASFSSVFLPIKEKEAIPIVNRSLTFHLLLFYHSNRNYNVNIARNDVSDSNTIINLLLFSAVAI